MVDEPSENSMLGVEMACFTLGCVLVADESSDDFTQGVRFFTLGGVLVVDELSDKSVLGGGVQTHATLPCKSLYLRLRCIGFP